eukprot:scaffold9626_cov114-Isochrysis_galbana.AAC.4
METGRSASAPPMIAKSSRRLLGDMLEIVSASVRVGTECALSTSLVSVFMYLLHVSPPPPFLMLLSLRRQPLRASALWHYPCLFPT